MGVCRWVCGGVCVCVGGGGGGGALSSLPQAEVAAAQVDGQSVVKLLDGDVHKRVRVPVVHNACGENAFLAAHR